MSGSIVRPVHVGSLEAGVTLRVSPWARPTCPTRSSSDAGAPLLASTRLMSPASVQRRLSDTDHNSEPAWRVVGSPSPLPVRPSGDPVCPAAV